VITDTDVEQLLITYLMANIGFSIPIATRIERLTVGDKRPPESIVLVRTGGPRRDQFTDQPTIAVDVRAPTETRAVAISNRVRALINDLQDSLLGGVQVYTVDEFSGPANAPDEPIDPVKYGQVFSIAVRSG
jgi:hypothetical protein